MSWIPFIDYLSKAPPEEPKADAVQEAHFQKLLQQERIIQSAQITEEEMPSCMTLFDRMMNCHGECSVDFTAASNNVHSLTPSWRFSCAGITPQLRHVYRYGHFNECTERKDNWKHCISLKGRSKEEKRQLWIERRARIMAERRMPGGDTSEEIWSIREQPIIEPEFVDAAFLPKTPAQETKSASSNQTQNQT